MASTHRHIGSANPAAVFSLLERRSLAVNTANRQLFAGDESGSGPPGTPLRLIAVRYFDQRAQYALNDFVINGAGVYRAKGVVNPGTFNSSQWDAVSDIGQYLLLDGSRKMTGDLELEKNLPTLYLDATEASNPLAQLVGLHGGLARWAVRLGDGTAAADYHVRRFNDAGAPIDNPLVISRSTGRLSVLTNPTLPLELAPKQYVDSTVAGAGTLFVLRDGTRDMTGNLTIRRSTPILALDATGSGDEAGILAMDGGVQRWFLAVANATGDFAVWRHNDAGSRLDAPLMISRATGRVSVGAPPISPLDLANKQYVDAVDTAKVNRAGDTVTGELKIDMPNPVLRLNRNVTGSGAAYIVGEQNGAPRWTINPGDGSAGDLIVRRFNDSGAVAGEGLNINRSTGKAKFGGVLDITSPGLAGSDNQPFTFKTNDLVGGLWTQITNSGVGWRQLFDSINCPWDGNCLKLANGLQINWGALPTDGQAQVNFPVPFPAFCLLVMVNVEYDGRPATEAYVTWVNWKAPNAFTYTRRLVNGADNTVSVPTGATGQYLAIGW